MYPNKDWLVKRMRKLAGDMANLSAILDLDEEEVGIDLDLLATDLARTRAKVDYAAWVIDGRPEEWDAEE